MTSIPAPFASTLACGRTFDPEWGWNRHRATSDLYAQADLTLRRKRKEQWSEKKECRQRRPAMHTAILLTPEAPADTQVCRFQQADSPFSWPDKM